MSREFQTAKPVGRVPSGKPDNIVTLDLKGVNVLQIGYQAETLYLKKSEDDSLIIREYIGLTGSEFFAKVSSNRIKTTVRYGRRDIVNTETCVEILIPESYHGEIQVSTQYGEILTEENWEFARFAAETSEGLISLKTLTCPRIRLATSTAPIDVDHSIGFSDVHSVDGVITVKNAEGGGRFTTSSSPVNVTFTRIDNIVECETLNGPIHLELAKDSGLIIDGISKTGDIRTDIEGLTLKIKPGNVKNLTGQIGEKPFSHVRLSTINGTIELN